jgi:hypothetical protein
MTKRFFFYFIAIKVKPAITLINYTIDSSQAENDLNIICDILGLVSTINIYFKTFKLKLFTYINRSPINSILWFKNSRIIKESSGFLLSDTSTHKHNNNKYSSVENIVIDDLNLQLITTRLDSFKLQSKLKFKVSLHVSFDKVNL